MTDGAVSWQVRLRVEQQVWMVRKSSRWHIWMAVDSLMKTSAPQFGCSYLKLQEEIRAGNINLSIWHLMASKLLNWITQKYTAVTQST